VSTCVHVHVCVCVHACVHACMCVNVRHVCVCSMCVLVCGMCEHLCIYVIAIKKLGSLIELALVDFTMVYGFLQTQTRCPINFVQLLLIGINFYLTH